MNGSQVDMSQVTPTEGGFRLRVTDEYIVDVHKMMFNWRLLVTLPEEDGVFFRHGYCYFGRGPEALHRAVAAGLAWEDPLHTHPEGYDKQAY